MVAISGISFVGTLGYADDLALLLSSASSCIYDKHDMNNYRAIALCNIDTKVLEKILLAEVTSYRACDDHQFGF